MPRIGIVGNPNNETNIDLALRWHALGLDAFLVSPGQAHWQLTAADVAVGRVDVRTTLDGVDSGIPDLLAASRNGARIVNYPEAVVAAQDKLRTAHLLEHGRLPHPRTEHVWRGETPSLAPPFVVKPRFGSWGVDVLRCDTPDEVSRVLAAISDRPWFRRHGAIVQELVPPVGYDLRVLVAGGTAVGSEERVAAPGEWRTNIALGGSHRRASPSAEAASLAVAAVEALGGDFFGVDLLPGPDGYVVLEVNAAVDFDDRYSLPGGDVYGDAAEALGLAEPLPVAIASPGSGRRGSRPGA